MTKLSESDLEFLRGLEPDYASLYIPYWNQESSKHADGLVKAGILQRIGEGVSRKGMWFDLTPAGRRALKLTGGKS